MRFIRLESIIDIMVILGIRNPLVIRVISGIRILLVIWVIGVSELFECRGLFGLFGLLNQKTI
jgi:hypothetical protein